MIQQGIGCKHDQFARLAHAQAVVHIIERDDEILVEPTERIEHGTLRHETGSGYDTQVLHKLCAAHIARVIAIEMAEDVHRTSIIINVTALDHHHAGVLNRIVGEQKLRAHDADILALAQASMADIHPASITSISLLSSNRYSPEACLAPKLLIAE